MDTAIFGNGWPTGTYYVAQETAQKCYRSLDGRGVEKEWMHVCVWLKHFVVHLILA